MCERLMRKTGDSKHDEAVDTFQMVDQQLKAVYWNLGHCRTIQREMELPAGTIITQAKDQPAEVGFNLTVEFPWGKIISSRGDLQQRGPDNWIKGRLSEYMKRKLKKADELINAQEKQKQVRAFERMGSTQKKANVDDAQIHDPAELQQGDQPQKLIKVVFKVGASIIRIAHIQL